MSQPDRYAIDTPIAPGVVARVSGALRAAWEAGMNAWFSALPPLPQVAPPGTPVRRYDFQIGQNISYIPRSGETTTFGQLRALADNYDLLRTVIETRKDQLAKMPWTIRPLAVGPRSSAGNAAGSGRRPKADDRWPDLGRVTAFFESPDGEHSLADWMRPLVEDVLVLDAPAIELIRNRGGELKQLLVIDGATIFPVIDLMTGFTPAPPAVAYQQIIKGVIAAELTTDELIYRPRNRRAHKLYGFSPVEQIVMSVNLGLRRQMSQLAYYTDGTVPDAYLGVPDTWTPDQIAEYQQVFDAYLAGNLHNRRKVFLGPDGKLQLLKEPDLKSDLDEWLARIVCFAFSINPQPFVREMNRATAQTAKAQSLEEGLQPLLVYFADLFNSIIRKGFGVAGVEFAWQDEKAEDPQDQADMAALLVAQGIITPNEARRRLGMDPYPGGDELRSAPLGSAAQDFFPQTAKLVKKKPVLHVSPGGEAARLDAVAHLASELTLFFRSQAKLVAAEIRRLYPAALAQMPPRTAEKLRKDGWFDRACQLADGIVDQIELSWDALVGTVGRAIKNVFTGAAALACSAWQALTGEIKPPLSGCITAEQVSEQAEAYARDHAAEMVGKRWVNGELVDNPNARWAITETTRDNLRSMIVDALDKNMSADELAGEIEGLTQDGGKSTFSAERAETIARTELANAFSHGYRAAARSAGAIAHRSLLAPTHIDIDECDDAAADGYIPIDQPFSNGMMGPPFHPRCRCTEEFAFPEGRCPQ